MTVRIAGPEGYNKTKPGKVPLDPSGEEARLPRYVRGGRYFRRVFRGLPVNKFGPLRGSELVKRRAGRTREVTKPSNVTHEFSPPNGLTNSAVSAAGTNAVIWLNAGTYQVTDWIYPLNGQTLICAPGTIINGNAGSHNINKGSGAGSTGVTIRGGYWTNFGRRGWTTADYSDPAYATNPNNPVPGVLYTDGRVSDVAFWCGQGWTIEDAEIAYNAQGGWYGSSSDVYQDRGDDITIRHCDIHHNGRMAFTLSGQGNTGPARPKNVVIEHNKIHHNNSDFCNHSYHAGSNKTLYSKNEVTRGNWLYDNYLGVPSATGTPRTDQWSWSYWWDTNCVDYVFEGNVIDTRNTNGQVGVIYDEHNGNGRIQRNHFQGFPTQDYFFGNDYTKAFIKMNDCQVEEYTNWGAAFGRPELDPELPEEILIQQNQFVCGVQPAVTHQQTSTRSGLRPTPRHLHIKRNWFQWYKDTDGGTMAGLFAYSGQEYNMFLPQYDNYFSGNIYNIVSPAVGKKHWSWEDKDGATGGWTGVEYLTTTNSHSFAEMQAKGQDLTSSGAKAVVWEY